MSAGASGRPSPGSRGKSPRRDLRAGAAGAGGAARRAAKTAAGGAAGAWRRAEVVGKSWKIWRKPMEIMENLDHWIGLRENLLV